MTLKLKGKVFSEKAGMLAIVAMLFLSAGETLAQNVIKGSVTDSWGPVSGASVMIKGSSTGTVTDLDGSYTIDARESDVLVFNFLGYKEVEEAVGDRTTINVKMVEDAELMDEVVVVGYGVQKKSLVTGSIASVKEDAFKKTGITRAEDALAGKTAGVQVVSNSGQPGSDVQIYIRGIGTNGTATPIYI